VLLIYTRSATCAFGVIFPVSFLKSNTKSIAKLGDRFKSHPNAKNKIGEVIDEIIL